MNNNTQPITNHLLELKNRLLVCCIAYFTCVCFSYLFSQEIYYFLTQPLIEAYGESVQDRRLIFTGLTEAFFTYISISMYCGFILAFPVIAYQLYFFVAPGMYRNEKTLLIPFLFAAPLLFFTGAALAYYYVMPMAWKFFTSFESIGNSSTLPIVLEARVSEYLTLVIKLIIGFGIAFQLPLILTLLTKVGILTGAWLAEKRRHAIVIIFVIAALLTPPDVISQIALAIPLVILYEMSVIICKRI